MTSLAAADTRHQERLTAAEWAAMLREPIKDHRYRTATQLGADIAEFLSWARGEDGKAPATLDQYERDLARGCVMYPHLDRHGWGKEEVRQVIASFPEASRYRAWAAHRKFWGWQYDEERIVRNPMQGIRQKKASGRKVIRVFSMGELAALVNAAGTMMMPEVHRARVLLLEDAGARAGEALAFRLEDANLSDRKVVLRGKGNKERSVPIRDELVRALDLLLRVPLPRIDRPLALEDYLFFPARVSGQYGDRREQVIWVKPGKPMVYSSFWRWWKSVIDRSGIKYRKPHTTRHTYATDMLTANDNLVSVRDALGHASTRTTEIYVHNVNARLDKAVDDLTAFRKLRSEV